VIGGDLRGISSVGSVVNNVLSSDIVAMTDSSIDFRYTIGVSVVCADPKSSNTIIIPPKGPLTNGNTLTSWILKPTFGDTVFVFDDGGNTTSPTDDSWQAFKVMSLPTGVGACDPGFNAPAGGTLTIDRNVTGTTLDGAPMRYVRHAHYSLYHNPGDPLWYLGYCTPDCTAGISPIAGPFMSYQASTSPDTSGIRITYYDSTGAVTNTPAQVARINIILRGETKSYLNIQGMQRGVYHDSLSMNIALRNRS
jgi:hypothetical protein